MSSPLLQPGSCPSLQGDVQSGDPALVSPLIHFTPLPAGSVALDSLYDPVRTPPPSPPGSSYCCEQCQRGFCPATGSLFYSAQRSNRRVLLFGSTPWLLQPVFSSSEEGWGFASYTRSAQAELLPLQREIQDADAQEHSFPGLRRGLICHGRPECSEAQEVPQVGLQGKVQGSSLWASSGSKDVDQVYGR